MFRMLEDLDTRIDHTDSRLRKVSRTMQDFIRRNEGGYRPPDVRNAEHQKPSRVTAFASSSSFSSSCSWPSSSPDKPAKSIAYHLHTQYIRVDSSNIVTSGANAPNTRHMAHRSPAIATRHTATTGGSPAERQSMAKLLVSAVVLGISRTYPLQSRRACRHVSAARFASSFRFS